MATDLLAFAGWYFLPNLATGYLQTALYTIFIRAGDPKPAPGSPRFTKDRRRIFVFVILAYLVYTVYEADWQLRRAGDFYRDLGVPHSISTGDLQSHFRKLTVKFHPDKLSSSTSAGDRAKADAFYVHLKLARDTLIDPARRFAYDRLGPGILATQSAKTIKDVVTAGLTETAMYYVGTGGVLVLLGMLGYLQQGRFWRYLVMAGLFVVEAQTIMRPEFPRLLTNFVNPLLVRTGLRAPYLPFQMLTLLRRIAVAFFIALSQLGPVLKGPDTLAGTDENVDPKLMDRLSVLGHATDQEVTRLMGLELTPFAEGEEGKRELKVTLKEWLVQNTMRNDPEVKAAIGAVLTRRRQEGLVGDGIFVS